MQKLATVFLVFLGVFAPRLVRAGEEPAVLGEADALPYLRDLHAKGVVTPLGIITGSTNITHSGLYAQSQNANYFAHGNADYAGNRTQLLGRYESLTAVQRIP